MIYAFGPCELDTQRCELRCEGEPRHVEPQVFDVLRHLVEHRERLVSKDELLDSIWGHRFVTPGTLNSRIKVARQAIGDDGAAQQVIRTVRGRGFRFVAAVEVRVGRAGDAPAPGPAIVLDVGDRPAAPRAPSTAGGRVAGMPAPSIGDSGSPAPALFAPTPPAVHLVGRAEELARLEALLADARGGARRVALVSGEAGVGKSTLVDALMGRAALNGVRVAYGQCLDRRGPGEPYLPLLDALGRLGREPGGPDVAAALETCAPSWLMQLPALFPPERVDAAQRRASHATRERMLRELVEAFELLTRDAPLLLVLEDLHWSDPSTLDFLAWIGQRREAARLFVLGTYRPGEADADLTGVITTLRRSPAFAEIALTPWTVAELREHLARSFQGRSIPDDLVALLHRRTEGNALFVQTLLQAWIERGLLDDGTPLAGSDVRAAAAAIPETLRLLLEQRLEQASRDDQCILEAASVAGVEFDAAAVAATLEAGVEEVEERCASLARRGRLLQEAGTVEWADGTWTARLRFGHQLFQEVLYERIPPARRARMHRALGGRLEAAFGADATRRAGELALHFRLGRDDERAIRYLRLAAEQAVRRSAHREAATHLSAAIELLRRHPELAEAPRLELELQRRLAPALLLTRGWGDPGAERAYARAYALSRDLDDPAMRARVLYDLAYLQEIRGNYHSSEALLKERLRLESAGCDPGFLIESHEMLSCSTFHQGQFSVALEHANRAREVLGDKWRDVLMVSLGDNAAVACHYWAGLALWFLGFPDRAVELVRFAMERAAGAELIYMRVASEIQMARLHHLRREPELAAERAARALRVAEDQGYPYHAAVAATLHGWARACAGEVEEAIDQIRRGLELQDRAGADMERPYCLGLLAEALMLAGRTAETLDTLEQALVIIQARARTFFWESELYRLRGEVRFGAGLHEDAALDIGRALEIATRQHSPTLELRAAVTLSRHERQLGRSGPQRRVARLYARFTEGLGTQDLRDARALVEGAG